jgi:hypothetical protein
MQVPSRNGWGRAEVAEADADAGQHQLGQANGGGVLVESTIRLPLYIYVRASL